MNREVPIVMISNLRSNKGKLPVLILIIIAVVAVAVVGTGIVVLSKGKAKGAKVEKKHEPEKLVALAEFVVNLADTSDSHYLKMELALGFEGEPPPSLAKAEGGEGGPEGLPIVRDIVINVAGKRTYNELLTEKGKQKLKDDIREALKESPVHLEVKGVYFTSFAMQ